jgi:hypothetical protein
MRTIHPELQARLDGGATRLCRCWRVRRRDGVALGFTDHDDDVVFEGVVHRASSGMDASALQAATGLSVDNAQAVGALSDAAVSEEDIRAGRYDGAEVWHWLVDWERPELRVLLFRGSFGEIRRADGWFRQGRLTWLSGANAGETATVMTDRLTADGSRALTLWRQPGSAVAVGDRFRIVAGCDKQAETCRAKFDNLLNFRGFPHLPGDDWVTAYPKDGASHDGGSLQGG